MKTKTKHSTLLNKSLSVDLAGCYSDMGSPAFWASLFPKPSDMSTPPSHITLAIWVTVRVTGDAHITRVLGIGMPTSLLHRKSRTQSTSSKSGTQESQE